MKLLENPAVLHILWLILTYLSIIMLYKFLGAAAVNKPIGARRWWHIAGEIACLAFFTTMILTNPFG